jgi:antitoxin component HigA of HigAB toxin-antitoxin module
MKISPVRNDEELKDALAAINELMKSKPALSSKDSGYLDVLATVVEPNQQ